MGEKLDPDEASALDGFNDFIEVVNLAATLAVMKDPKLDPGKASLLEAEKKNNLGRRNNIRTQIPRNLEISFTQESFFQGEKNVQESEENFHGNQQEHILILGRGNNIPTVSHNSQQFSNKDHKGKGKRSSNLDNQEDQEFARNPIISRSQNLLNLANNYNPPDRPCHVVGLEYGIIGRCSKPFEKQLTTSDVKDGQYRLILNKPDVKNYLLPWLCQHEDLIKGIDVMVYDGEGKSYHMIFKLILASKTYVLDEGWKKFYKEHNLLVHEDFVTIWMFRHLINRTLCFVINSRRLPVNFCLKKKTLNGKKVWSIR